MYRDGRTQKLVIALIALQSFCAIFFVIDVSVDYSESSGDPSARLHVVLEAIASLALVGAIVIEIGYLRMQQEETERLRRRLSMAGSAIEAIVDTLFEQWQLSPAEQDVGTLLVKGMSIAEIAELRGNADGTIKAHLNAIYRKSGTRNRSEVLSLIVDAVMGRDAEAEAFAAETMYRPPAAKGSLSD